MFEQHLLKLRARDEISAEEEAAIRASFGPPREIATDKILIPAGVPVQSSTLLLEGMMCRYKDLRGGQRQITALHIPGDFLDLHGFTLKYLDQAVMALTPCRIISVSHDRLTEITEHLPHLTRVYWFSTNVDASIHREWVVSVGSRSGLQRTAHLLCELQVRLELVGLADERGYAFPLTQAEIGECLGLTPVHVNRMVRQLRELALADLRGGRVQILDLEGLKNLADFDPAYLYLEKRPR